MPLSLNTPVGAIVRVIEADPHGVFLPGEEYKLLEWRHAEYGHLFLIAAPLERKPGGMGYTSEGKLMWWCRYYRFEFVRYPEGYHGSQS